MSGFHHCTITVLRKETCDEYDIDRCGQKYTKVAMKWGVESTDKRDIYILKLILHGKTIKVDGEKMTKWQSMEMTGEAEATRYDGNMQVPGWHPVISPRF